MRTPGVAAAIAVLLAQNCAAQPYVYGPGLVGGGGGASGKGSGPAPAADDASAMCGAMWTECSLGCGDYCSKCYTPEMAAGKIAQLIGAIGKFNEELGDALESNPILGGLKCMKDIVGDVGDMLDVITPRVENGEDGGGGAWRRKLLQEGGSVAGVGSAVCGTAGAVEDCLGGRLADEALDAILPGMGEGLAAINTVCQVWDTVSDFAECTLAESHCLKDMEEFGPASCERACCCITWPDRPLGLPSITLSLEGSGTCQGTETGCRSQLEIAETIDRKLPLDAVEDDFIYELCSPQLLQYREVTAAYDGAVDTADDDTASPTKSRGGGGVVVAVVFGVCAVAAVTRKVLLSRKAPSAPNGESDAAGEELQSMATEQAGKTINPLAAVKL